MGTVPSVKGAMLVPAVVQVRRGRDRGTISEPELAKLQPETLELLDEQIQLSRWYPMTQFGELLDIDWTAHGHRDPDYMRQSGERNAAMMERSSRYQQIDYVKRAGRPKSTAEMLSQLRMTSSVTLSYFNFMDVKVQMHPERPNVVQIIYLNTDAFPDALRYSSEGFMNGMNQMRGSSRKWSSERVRDTIVFSLELKQKQD